MTNLLIGLLLFLGVHSISIIAPNGRDRVVARVGRLPWQGIYGLIALAGLILVFRGYGEARAQPIVVYTLPLWIRAISTTLMLPVFPLLLATYLPGMIRTAVQHPTLVAVKLWALAHLLANGTLADIVLFGALMVWAVADRISLKHRAPRSNPQVPAGRWNDWIAVGGGMLIYGVMLNGGHAWITGIPLVLP
jgi:uncharacterized membrane protein